MRNAKTIRGTLALLLLLYSTQSMAGQDEERRKKLAELGVTGVAKLNVLGEHGDPGESVDIVFIGDGFTEAEMKDYRTLIDRMAGEFRRAPFDAYSGRVNLYRIDLPSEVSGVKGDGKPSGTPLEGGVNGKLCAVNEAKTMKLVQEAVPEVDHILIVLNTHGNKIGSANSGVTVKVCTHKSQIGRILIHEFGHNFVTLLDEYVKADLKNPPASLGEAANLSLKKDVRLAKWHHWNIPDNVWRGRSGGRPFRPEKRVACWEGGANYPKDVFRAEEKCIMRGSGSPKFCYPCCEAMEIGMLRYVNLIEEVSPFTSDVRMTKGESVDFKIRHFKFSDPKTRGSVTFYLNGTRLKQSGNGKFPGGALRLKASDLREGVNYVTATVDIESPRVHKDEGTLSGSYTWTVVLGDQVELGAEPSHTVVAGEELSFDVTKDAWKLADAPQGATLDSATGRFAWTPGSDAKGAYALVFEPTGDNRPIREFVQVHVRGPEAKKRNRAPKFSDLPAPSGRQGELLEFTLNATDPEGEHLAYKAENLPPRARLNPNTGKVTWEVGLMQRGSYELKFEVSDGVRTQKTSVRCTIAAHPRYSGKIRRDSGRMDHTMDELEWMLVGVRHPVSGIRLSHAGKLADSAPVVAVAESVRLLRDSNDSIRKEALATLTNLFGKASEGDSIDTNRFPLDLFFDLMTRTVWQSVDRPEILDWLRELCERLGKEYKAAKRLHVEIQGIDRYNKDRHKKSR